MASDNRVTCFCLLTTFKAFLEQSESQTDDIFLLQLRKILTMHVCIIGKFENKFQGKELFFLLV